VLDHSAGASTLTWDDSQARDSPAPADRLAAASKYSVASRHERTPLDYTSEAPQNTCEVAISGVGVCCMAPGLSTGEVSMDQVTVAYWLTWVGTGAWVICFWWMHRITAR
jgi:hypothetical protein